MPTVAVSSDFFTAFANIPRKQQNKVLNFVNKFRNNPTSKGINYEKIHDFKDKNLRSVRIDGTYRGIVLKPESGNVYMLLWVDHHDEAYAWGKNRVCSINPQTGCIQIYDVQTTRVENNTRPSQAHADRSEDTTSLFAGFRDRDFLALGVPEDLLPLVRSLATKDELEHQSGTIPQEVYEALFYLAEGFSVEEVFNAIQTSVHTDTIDTENFAQALEHPFSKQRFYVVEDELELTRMLEEPLEKWRVFLHPVQRNLVQRQWSGPVRVLGSAGTGKTVVAMHRTKWLAENLFTNSDDRILFTTFTKNLASDIRENLTKICTQDAIDRIDVINLDDWAHSFLKRNDYNFTIALKNRTKPLWKEALTNIPEEMSLPTFFYRKEWEHVIQPNEIRSLSQYQAVQRNGQGIALSVGERERIWPVFEKYLILLDEHKLREPEDSLSDARKLLQETSRNDQLPYRAVVVDEAQDMGTVAFKLLRQMVPQGGNDMFIVGDCHQRIYGKQVVLKHCGINITGRGRRLLTNYRTTEETGKWATALLRNVQVDDMDGGIDETKGYTSLLHGDPPLILRYDSFDAEISGIVETLEAIRQTEGTLSTTCITARTYKYIEKYQTALQQHGILVYPIVTDGNDDRTQDGIRMSTMHRIKGLEFDYMIICGANKGVIPLEYTNSSAAENPGIQEDFIERERSLFYVASTRAKKRLVVTGVGEMSEFVGVD